MVKARCKACANGNRPARTSAPTPAPLVPAIGHAIGMPHRLGSRSGTLLADQQIGGPPNVEFGNHAAIGALRLGSLFLTLPTRGLNGQHIIPRENLSASNALTCRGSVGCSRSSTGQLSGARITGVRSFRSAHSALGAR